MSISNHAVSAEQPCRICYTKVDTCNETPSSFYAGDSFQLAAERGLHVDWLHTRGPKSNLRLKHFCGNGVEMRKLTTSHTKR